MDEVGIGPGCPQGSAQNEQVARLLVDGRGTGDRAANDAHVAGRQVDGDVVSRGHRRAVMNLDDGVGHVAAVGGDGGIAGVGDGAEDVEGRRLAAVLAVGAVTPDDDLAVDGSTSIKGDRRRVIGVEASDDGAVVDGDLTIPCRDATGQLVTAKVDHEALADVDVLGHVCEQFDGVAVLGSLNCIGKRGIERVANLCDGLGPPGLEGHIGGHRRGEVISGARVGCVPAGKDVAVHGRSLGLGGSLAVLDGLGSDLGATLAVERDIEGLVVETPQAVRALDERLALGHCHKGGVGVVTKGGGGVGRDEAGLGLVALTIGVGSDGAALGGDERATLDGGLRLAVGIAAVLDHEGVARRVGAVAIEAVGSCVTRSMQLAAGHAQRARLLVDGCCAGDGAAGDGRIARRQVDGDLVRGGDVCTLQDVDHGARHVGAVGSDGSVTGVGDGAKDVEGRRLAAVLAVGAIAPDDDLALDGGVGRDVDGGLIVGVEAPDDGAVGNRDLAGVGRHTTGQLVSAKVEREVLGDGGLRRLHVDQQLDGVTRLRGRNGLGQALEVRVTDLGDGRDDGELALCGAGHVGAGGRDDGDGCGVLAHGHVVTEACGELVGLEHVAVSRGNGDLVVGRLDGLAGEALVRHGDGCAVERALGHLEGGGDGAGVIAVLGSRDGHGVLAHGLDIGRLDHIGVVALGERGVASHDGGDAHVLDLAVEGQVGGGGRRDRSLANRELARGRGAREQGVVGTGDDCRGGSAIDVGLVRDGVVVHVEHHAVSQRVDVRHGDGLVDTLVDLDASDGLDGVAGVGIGALGSRGLEQDLDVRGLERGLDLVGVFLDLDRVHGDRIGGVFGRVGKVCRGLEGAARDLDCRDLGAFVHDLIDGRRVDGRHDDVAGDAGRRRTARVVAALDDDGVACGEGTVAGVDVVLLLAVAGDGATGDGESAGLLVDGRGTGDGAAGHGEAASCRLVDGDVSGGGDGSTVDGHADVVACVAIVADGDGVSSRGFDGAVVDHNRGGVEEGNGVRALARRLDLSAVDGHQGGAIVGADGAGLVTGRDDVAAVDGDRTGPVAIDGVVANSFALDGSGLEHEAGAGLDPDRVVGSDLAAAHRVLDGQGHTRAHGVEQGVAITADGLASEVDGDALLDFDVARGHVVSEHLDGVAVLGGLDRGLERGVGGAVNLSDTLGPRGGEGDVRGDSSREVVVGAFELPGLEDDALGGRDLRLSGCGALGDLLRCRSLALAVDERDGHSLDKLEALALGEPHLVVGHGDGVVRGSDGRELGLTVSVVASNALGVIGREGAARDVGNRGTTRVAAALDDECVAGGVGTVAIEAVGSGVTRRMQLAAGDVEGAALLIDGRGASDGAAGDSGCSSAGEVDSSNVRRHFCSVTDVDSDVLGGAAVGGNCEVAAAVDGTVDGERLVLGEECDATASEGDALANGDVVVLSSGADQGIGRVGYAYAGGNNRTTAVFAGVHDR